LNRCLEQGGATPCSTIATPCSTIATPCSTIATPCSTIATVAELPDSVASEESCNPLFYAWSSMRTDQNTYYPAGIYHVTWVTYKSRVSQRMIDYHIKNETGIRLDEKAEIKVTEIIAGIVSEKNYTVYAYNICRDHVHILIECEENKVSNIVRQIKGKSSQLYKEYLGKASHDQFHLWAQKFNKWLVQSDEQLQNTVEYILHNREKHGLPENKGLQPLVLFCHIE
jgi:REP element-mobilizing transposase RayT